MIIFILTVITVLVEAVLSIMIGYLLLLTLGAVIGQLVKRGGATAPRVAPDGMTRFAILVPAHDEERLLPELLGSLQAQDYPRDRMTVCVVADNCRDGTARLARQFGASVYERFDADLRGKGYALNWLLERVNAAEWPAAFDAFVIFDADSVVAPQFLRVMDARLRDGANAVQGYYAVRDPGRSWGAALRFAALAVLHYLRPLGRDLFGVSAGLKGNGMCFRADLYQRNAWSGSVTEDIEYHMRLLLAGQRVAFAPDARLEAEMPGTLKSSATQNVRWESGRLQAARTYVPQLLRCLPRGRPCVYIDAVMEHLIPPTAAVVMGVVAGLILGGLVGWMSGAWVLCQAGVVLLAGLAVYIVCGLWMVRAPARVWLGLLYAPFYALWKVALLIRIVLGKQKQGWVRTAR